MEYTKDAIKAMVRHGKLQEAIRGGLVYAEFCGLTEIVNALSNLAQRQEDHQQKWHTQQISYEDFSRIQSQLNSGVLGWIDRLPDHPRKRKAKRRLMDEARLKRRIFYGLCLTKLIILIQLYVHWDTGGFSKGEFRGTVALLAPTLSAYISVMLADYLRTAQRLDTRGLRYVDGPLVHFSLFLFPLYFLALYYFIDLKARSVLSFAEMNLWLGLVETGLGGYIGRIVYAFFRRE